MKKSNKSRVSWASDSMLCQVKMFETEDCPAKVAWNLPPGFEGSECACRRNIPRIQWKRPPKFVVSDDLLVGSGGESTESRCENLRIAKVLEAFYPHRSAIPSRPSVSPVVEDESYDDTKTPNVRLTPIEDELEAAAGSSHNPNAPAAVPGPGPGPDLRLAVSAALSAVMKTKEPGSLVDADLLVKFLSDPKIIKNLMMGTLTTKPPQPRDHVSVQSGVSSAPSMNLHLQKPPLVFPTYPLSSGPSPVDDVPVDDVPVDDVPVDDVLAPEPKTQPQSLNISSWHMPESAGTGTDAQICNPMKVNRDEQVPVKNVEYYKNLIRQHGGVTNNYKGRVDNDNIKVVKVKVQKACIYFGRARGCKLGERCLYRHDRSNKPWTNVATEFEFEFPTAKRLKFGT